MAEGDPPSPPPPANDQRRWVLPFVMALLTVTLAVATYYVVYLTRQRNYFAERSARLLGVVAHGLEGSLKAQIASLGFKKDDEPSKETPLVECKPMVPDRNAVLRVQISRGPALGFLAFAMQKSGSPDAGGNAWKEPVAVDLRTFVDWTLLGERFDDVWLVDADGQVLAQLNSEAQPAPKQIKVHDATDPAGDKGWGARVADLAVPNGVQHVDVWGARYLVFAYPIDLTKSFERGGSTFAVKTELADLHLYGVVGASRFTGDAVALSYRAWMVLSVILLLVFLALPYLKVRFMARRERLRWFDIWLLGASGIAAAHLATVVIVTLGWEAVISTRMDEALHRLASEIDANANSELTAATQQLEADALQLMAEKPGMRGNTLAEKPRRNPYPYFEASFYTDRAGWQIAKRNPWFTPTACVSIGDQSYFTAALWRPKMEQGTHGEPVLASIDTPNTGKQLAVLALPIRAGPTPAVGFSIPRGERTGVAVLAAELQSLIEPVTPFPLEYVVLDGKGTVLFRSQSGKNARENFLAEVDWSSHLHAQAATGASLWLNARYLGRPHRMYVAPFRVSANEPRLLVTYYDRTVIDTLMYEATTAALPWILFESLLVALAAVFSRVLLGPRFGDWMWPTERRSMIYVLASLACLTIAAGLLLVVHFVDGAWGPWLVIVLPPVLLFAMSLPPLQRLARPVADTCEARVGVSHALYPYSYLMFGVALLVLAGMVPAAVTANEGFASYGKAFLRFTERGMASALEKRWQHVDSLYVAGDPDPTGRTIAVPPDDERTFECERLARTWDVYSPLFAAPNAQVRAVSSVGGEQPCDYLANRYLVSTTATVPRCGLGLLLDHAVWSQHNALVRVAAACLPATGALGLDLRAQIFTADTNDPPASKVDGAAHWAATRDGGALWKLPLPVPWRLLDLPWWPTIMVLLIVPAIVVLVIAWLVTRSVATDILGLELEGDGVLDHTQAMRGYFRARQGHLGQLAAGEPSTEPAPQRWLVLRPPQALLKEFPVDFGVVDLSDPTLKDPDPATGAAIDDQASVIRAVESRLESSAWRKDLIRRMGSARDKPLLLVSDIDPMYWLVARANELKAVADQSDEIARWASMLAAFTKGRFSVPDEIAVNLVKALGAPTSRRARRAIDVIVTECKWTDELAEIGKRLDVEELASLHRGQIVDLIEDQAEPYYRKIWSLCSVEEKLVLVQLAEEGMVNPRHFDVLRRLRRRRLVRTHAQIRLMNESFARFVRGAETPTQVAEWERLEGIAGSARVRLPLMIMATVAAGLLLFTQQQLFDSLTGMMTAAVAAVTAVSGILTSLRGQFGSRPAK